MPEKTCLKLFEREVHWEEAQVSKRIDRSDEKAFHGRFVAHPECCARVEGRRQTFSVHVSAPNDPHFIQLQQPPPPPPPKPKKTKDGQEVKPPPDPFFCKCCSSSSIDDDDEPTENLDTSSRIVSASHPKPPLPISGPVHPCLPPTPPSDDNAQTFRTKPPAEYVNELDIVGRISAKARGKELCVAICNRATGRNFIFRVGFHLEAHCFWIPTEWYKAITSASVVRRGVKSWAYSVPDSFVDGPPRSDRVISIQAAFIRPKWTLIFCDHNSLIQFHLMRAGSTFIPSHMEPGSSIWSSLWSATHGPVYSQEPVATLKALDDWRSEIVRSGLTFTPIFLSIKFTQTVFNGSGAQEATDLLLLSLIHPLMPTFYVCTDNAIWHRFRQAFIDYDTERMNLALPSAGLPYVSSLRPFRMPLDGHTKYLSKVYVYKRLLVILSADLLARAHALNLFLPNATIMANGSAELPPGSSPCEPSLKVVLRTDRRQSSEV
ncbi:hypothetical protein C8R43DRAFT_1132482 [Mycena crocata]|nr:hypothetical protein C8R43DRAFT_1132482 [Mycena crocata]